MKKEDKDLQLRDLCGRLPYLPKVHADDGLSPDGKGSDYTLLGINANKRIVLLGLDFDGVYATHKEYLDNIKPYLRPMSSMTEEEKKELRDKNILIAISTSGTVETTVNGFDWLNKNKFDYHGLIEKGLALEASKDMYNEIKEEKK
jgi:hypothetical protein